MIRTPSFGWSPRTSGIIITFRLFLRTCDDSVFGGGSGDRLIAAASHSRIHACAKRGVEAPHDERMSSILIILGMLSILGCCRALRILGVWGAAHSGVDDIGLGGGGGGAE